MCDCYESKCENCGCNMSIHIADYCTDRKNIHPYCNRCSKKLSKSVIKNSKKVFYNKIEMIESIEGTKSKHIGQQVIILCDDKEAYGIHLN